MPDDNMTAQCESALVELRANLVSTLGTAAVDVLLDRAFAEVSHTYPELSLIQRHEDALSFDALNEQLVGKSAAHVIAAFSALTGVLLLVMARILGKTMARQLAGNGGTGDQGGYWLGEQ